MQRDTGTRKTWGRAFLTVLATGGILLAGCATEGSGAKPPDGSAGGGGGDAAVTPDAGTADAGPAPTDAGGLDGGAQDTTLPDVPPAGDVAPDVAPSPDAADGAETTDTGDAGETDAGGTSSTLSLPGLHAPVTVYFDEYGTPHIRAKTWEDAFMAEGYLHARDRFVQMELARRVTSGTLAKLVGGLDDGAIKDDFFARAMGFRRIGEGMYAETPPDSPARRALDAYAAGVNVWIDRLRSGDESLPGPLQGVIPVDAIEDWDPVDGLVITHFQQFRLGFDAASELRWTQRHAAWQAAFNTQASDEALAKRAGAEADLFRMAPADPTAQFPHWFDKSGPPSPSKPVAKPATAAHWVPPEPAALEVARRFLESFRGAWSPFGPLHGASNSWVVSPDVNNDGAAILANDPHLDLDSPALFYEVHMTVEPDTPADGPALDLYGVGFAGVPGVLLGHNAHVAWGFTTADYDYSDAFEEQLTDDPNSDWPAVMHGEQAVPLKIYEETIEVGTLGAVSETLTVHIPWVPGRGPLAVDFDGTDAVKPTGSTAISFAWRGFEPSHDFEALVAWWLAGNVGDVQQSLDKWEVGSQNLVFADTDGNIFITAQSYLPLRPEAAMSWDPVTQPDGTAPWWVLPGTGDYDWIEGGVPRDQIPHALNPPEGFGVTANNDQAGVTFDGNPLNDPVYLGWDYDIGFRAGRITRLLQQHIDAGTLDAKAIADIQVDDRSNFGERLAPFLVDAGTRLLEEYDAPGTHPDLSAIVQAHPGAHDRVAHLIDIVANWDDRAVDGVWGVPTSDDIASAVATSVFNYWAVATIRAAFWDERAQIEDPGLGTQDVARAILFLLEHPTEAATYDPALGYSVLWDDLATPDVTETPDAIIASALFTADEKATAAFGTDDTSQWRWGIVHTKVFKGLLDDLLAKTGLGTPFTLPGADEPWPNGYPRPGDNFNVNPCGAGLTDFSFSCGGGPIQRIVVQMNPGNIVTWNALPGGEVWDPKSPHFRDQLDLWLNNDRREVPFEASEVEAAATQTLVLQPAP